MIHRLDIDCGDIIGQQHNLIGVYFVFIFIFQLIWCNQPRLQQAGDKGARAGKRIKDMHALAAQRLAKLGLQHVINGMDDKIHHLDRGVNDTQLLRHGRECRAEKFIV